jgi:hypothetical protein
LKGIVVEKTNVNFKSEFVSSVVISAIFLLMLFIPRVVFAGEAGSSNDWYKNDTFGFSIRMPEGWLLETEEMPDEITVTATEPKDNGTVFVISVDLPGVVPVQDFIGIMEDELAKELSFMNMKEGKAVAEAPAGQAGEQPRMVYRKYGGRYYGFKMKALIGYTVTGNYGYCVVGVYADSDKDTERAVSRSIGSFALAPGMS